MKKLKIISAILASVLTVGVLAPAFGCGGSSNDSNILNICVVNGGYGTEWIESMMTEFFNSDAKYSDYKYNIIKRTNENIEKDIPLGINGCNYDLVFHAGNPTLISGEYLEDISSVYGMPFKDSTLKDYMDESIVSSFKQGDKFTSIPWTTSVSSLIINYGLVTERLGAGWESIYKNRTTEEFKQFVSALKVALRSDEKPFVINIKKGFSFYNVMYEIWWAQYEGMTGYENFFKARYYDEDTETYREGPAAFVQNGRLEALKATAEIVSAVGNYDTKDEPSSMQITFMEGKSAMIANGDWTMLEQNRNAKGRYNDIDIRFIKMPVISALGEKLGITETELRQVIDYVDGAGAKPSVDDDIIAEIKDARRMVYSGVDYSCACIPVYSIKKDVSVEFLKWMYSEAGQKKYVAAMSGLTLPVVNSFRTDSEVNKYMNVFTKSAAALSENAIYVFPNRNWKYARASLAPFAAVTEGVIEYLLTGLDKASVNKLKDPKKDYSDVPDYEIISDYDKYYYEKLNGNNWNELKNRADALERKVSGK